MNFYIEVGKVTKKDKEKSLITYFSDGEDGSCAHVENIKSKKQRLQIVEALLDLAYEIEADAEYRKNKNAG